MKQNNSLKLLPILIISIPIIFVQLTVDIKGYFHEKSIDELHLQDIRQIEIAYDITREGIGEELEDPFMVITDISDISEVIEALQQSERILDLPSRLPTPNIYFTFLNSSGSVKFKVSIYISSYVDDDSAYFKAIGLGYHKKSNSLYHVFEELEITKYMERYIE